MACIYKRGKDQQNKRKCWIIGYSDYNGKRRTVKGFTDRGATEQLAAKLEHEAMLRRRKLIDPVKEQIAGRKSQPIEVHLSAFEESLAKRTDEYRKLVMTRVRRIVAGCSFKTVGDIEGSAVQKFIWKFCEENDFGNKTSNHYLAAFGAFCNWLVNFQQLLTSPISMLEPLNTEIDNRHPRRALSLGELQQLAKSARQSGKIVEGFDGEQRARIYLISYFTGFRRREISSLTPGSFDLNSSKPTVTIEAAFSKHRRRDVMQLHHALVEMLSAWLSDVPADQVLFPRLAKRKTWLMVKKDLARTGIPYKTSEGVADFHAIGRHTHITALDEAGVGPSMLQTLARHSDFKTTRRYIHVGAKEQSQAIQLLPWQRFSSVSNVPSGHSESPMDAEPVSKQLPKKHDNPGKYQGYDAKSHTESSADAKDKERRARDSNPQPIAGQLISNQSASHSLTLRRQM